jgi:hypothetical protein
MAGKGLALRSAPPVTTSNVFGVDAGVASLLGALAGGAASFAGNAYAQRSQRKRDAYRRSLETEERAIIAARIIQGDLAWAEARVDAALRNGKYWSQRYALRDASWHEYREAIALSLNNPVEWSAVDDGFRAIDTLELQAGHRRSANPQSRPTLSAFGRERAVEGLEQIRHALAVLEPLAGKRAAEEASAEE